MNETQTDNWVNVMTVTEGDYVDMGSSRTRFRVWSVKVAKTGRVGVTGVSHGRMSTVWFNSTESKVNKVTRRR